MLFTLSLMYPRYWEREALDHRKRFFKRLVYAFDLNCLMSFNLARAPLLRRWPGTDNTVDTRHHSFLRVQSIPTRL